MSRKALGRGLSALFSQSVAHDVDMAEIGIDQLVPSPSQPRNRFREEKLEELAQSIKSNGIIQPVVVRRSGEQFEIIAGERRWRAAQRAGLHTLPCIIKDVADENVLELSLIENLQREELNPIEEATAYRRLIEKFELTQDEIAGRIGKDRTSITNCLRLLKLPKEIQSLVEEERLSMGHARAILGLTSADKQRSAVEQVLRSRLSVRDTERLVKNWLDREGKQQSKPKLRDIAVTERANIAAAESKLRRRLGAPVAIKFHGKGGSIQVKFSTPEDLSRIFDLIMHRTSNAE